MLHKKTTTPNQHMKNIIGDIMNYVYQKSIIQMVFVSGVCKLCTLCISSLHSQEFIFLSILQQNWTRFQWKILISNSFNQVFHADFAC